MKPIKIKMLIVLSTIILIHTQAQKKGNLTFLYFNSRHTSFPDTARLNARTYKNVVYDVTQHYCDNKVLIIVPHNIPIKDNIDLIFWFHGWNNSIDSAVLRYNLIRQFEASHKLAALILPETAKNAPDSYGGKLEQKGMFKNLIKDVLLKLKKERIIKHSCGSGNIILSGHSGAYRVIAHILQKGEVQVKETILFDALYAETEKFLDWIKADSSNHFINIYTDQGGTVNETNNMMKQMALQNIPYRKVEESDLIPLKLKNDQILIIHSLREHDYIINDPDNFSMFITNSPFLHK